MEPEKEMRHSISNGKRNRFEINLKYFNMKKYLEYFPQ
jgi:hypothetical protein